jgi:arylsulfatase A-like enzyme
VALLHVALVTTQFHLLRQFTWTSRDIVWMAPLAYLGLFALALVPAWSLARLGRPRWGEVLLVAFAAWLVLLFWQKLNPIATMVLALGIGVAVAGAWRTAARTSPAALRRAVAALTLLAVAIAATTVTARAVARAFARSGSAPADAPNVLLLILDTMRAQNMSLYGYARATTPNLERLATESVVFDNAIVTSSWSLPSHAGMLTALWPHQLGGSYLRPVRLDAPTIAEVFRQRGYATAGFCANMLFAGHESGFARGFERFDDFPRNVAQLLLTPTLSQTEAVKLAVHNARAGYLRGAVLAFKPGNLRIVGARRAARAVAPDRIARFLAWSAGTRPRPFFAFVNLMETHAPYEVPEPYHSAFGGGEREFDRYDGAIAYLDSLVSGALDELRRRGELDRTLVVITSDHGELFGEHGFDGHGTTLYLPAIRVPLVMRFPGRVPAAVRVTKPVSLRDLPATLLDLAGLRADAPFPGTSLRETWTVAGSANISPAFSEASQGVNVPATNQNYAGPIHSVVDSATHYIRLGDGREELYDWRADPHESRNLAATAEHAVTVALRRRFLDSLLARSGQSR